MAEDSVVYWLACRRATDRLEHGPFTAVLGDTGSDSAAVWHRYFNGTSQMPSVSKGASADWNPISTLPPLRAEIWRLISYATIRQSATGRAWPTSSFGPSRAVAAEAAVLLVWAMPLLGQVRVLPGRWLLRFAMRCDAISGRGCAPVAATICGLCDVPNAAQIKTALSALKIDRVRRPNAPRVWKDVNETSKVVIQASPTATIDIRHGLSQSGTSCARPT